MKKNKKHTGGTLVELIMVMTLMTLLGFSIFTMVELGGSTQRRITEDKDMQVDARIALSYLNVRLRQNDIEGRITVKINEATGKTAIVLRDRGLDYSYDTWIYYSDGQMRECITDPGEQPNDELSFKIVDLDDFYVEYDPQINAVNSHITYRYNDRQNSVMSMVSLRNTGSIISD